MKCTNHVRAMAIASLLAPGVAAAQSSNDDVLAPARSLYDAAEYEGALTALDRIAPDGLSRGQLRERSLYRALCQLALNREQDATTTIEHVVSEDPFVRLEEDMPRRLRQLLDQVRARLLPKLAEQHYQAGKKLFEAAEYNKALDEFAVALQIIDDMAGDDSADDSLRDTRVLVAGFRDLAQRSMAVTKPLPPPSPARDGPAAPTPPAIVPPTAVSQQLPDYPPLLTPFVVAPGLRGTIEVVVDESGDVQSASVVEPIHPLYDPLLLTAAKQWKYTPATRNGVPIAFVKRIEIVLRSR